jgi:hypothetical protein
MSRKGVRCLNRDPALLGPGSGADQADLPDVGFLAEEGSNGRADDQDQFLAQARGL